ncbi:hypothetical protein K440DRAFT_90093 [Wilcoxina mikolae CBS 423.85]|nr:hypothetical protein K440DRAFT_90093 [Wilcoxina mikolae CBS 423.85]
MESDTLFLDWRQYLSDDLQPYDGEIKSLETRESQEDFSPRLREAALGNATVHADWLQYLSNEAQRYEGAIENFEASISLVNFRQLSRQLSPFESFLRETSRDLNHPLVPLPPLDPAAPHGPSPYISFTQDPDLSCPLESHEVYTIDPAELTRNSNNSTTFDDEGQWEDYVPVEPADTTSRSSILENESVDAAVTVGSPDTPPTSDSVGTPDTPPTSPDSQPTSDSMEDGLYHCHYCDYSSTNMNHVKQHQFKHGEGTTCDTCQKRLSRPSALLRHIRILHPRAELRE